MPSTIAMQLAMMLGPAGDDPIAPPRTTTITIPLEAYEALLQKIAALEQSRYEDSWRLNPDRMGS